MGKKGAGKKREVISAVSESNVSEKDETDLIEVNKPSVVEPQVDMIQETKGLFEVEKETVADEKQKVVEEPVTDEK